MTFAFIILVAIQASGDRAAVENDIWSQTPLRKVAEIDLPASALNGNWQPSNGLKLNDLSDLTDVPEPIRQAANAIAKQLKPMGVCSVADYSLISTDFPLNTVTVRVFVFEDAVRCKKWWKKKYEYDGWEKHYIKVDSDSARVVRSTQANKTAMAFGNVWLTTHQLRKGDDHITAANHVLKLLTKGAKSLLDDAIETPEEKVEETTDKSGEFRYELLKGWEKRDIPQFKHDVVILPKVDNNNRTIIVTDQLGPGPLENIVSKYERDLPKALKNFKLVSSKIVTLADESKAAKIVHTNSQPGVPVRQINYVIKIKGKYYFIAYTGLQTDGTKFDEAVRNFVASVGPTE